jgi:Na+-transporting NADH:ubiquinone oxidoreductase subunit NqrC
MSKPEGENKDVKKPKGGMIVAVIAIVTVVAALVVVIVVMALRLSKRDKAEEPKEQKDVISAENVQEVLEEWVSEDEDKYIPQYFTVVQNTEWTFPDGSSPSVDAVVGNDAENETPVYFDVVVDATGETVLSSPILELGAQIEKFKLDKVLEKGDYDCTMIYHLVDEEQNELTTVNVGVTIHILN